MSVKTGKKIGFLASLSIALGAIIGIGIFLKNISVIRDQLTENGNSFSIWSLLLTWIFSAIISLCTAYSFTEISTCKKSKSGLAGWVSVLGGKTMGRLTQVSHTTIYFGILGACIPFLALEGIFAAISSVWGIKFHYGQVFAAGFVLFVGLTILNYFSINLSSKLQTGGTFLKLIPLVLSIFVGLIPIHGSNVLVSPENISGEVGNFTNTLTKVKITAKPSISTFNITGVFSSIPSILFAFDSFLSIGNMADDVKKPEKTIPMVAIFSILISAIIYLLVTLGAAFVGTGDVAKIISSIVKGNENGIKWIQFVIYIFISLSAIFVSNSFTMAGLRSSEAIVNEKSIMFFSTFEKLNKKRNGLGGLVLFLIQILFFMIIFGIPSVIMNNDAILDSATNAPVLIFFLVYAITMILGIIDRKKQQRCNKVKGYMFASIIGIIAIFLTFIYVFAYQNFYELIVSKSNSSSAGLFFDHKSSFSNGGSEWKRSDDAILFWSIFIFAILWSVLNLYVVNIQRKKLNIDLNYDFETVQLKNLNINNLATK